MLKHNNIYRKIEKKVGLSEDREYQKLYNPKDIWGESLGPLARRNFKRFIAVLYGLIVEKQSKFDLIVGAGDSGIALSEITRIFYKKLNKELPLVINLPVVRFKFTYLKYQGQPLELFDNSVLIPEVTRELKGLKKLKSILYVDDEIANGVTAKEAMRAILKAADKKKIAKKISLIIVAEDQDFDPRGFLENVVAEIYPFAKGIKGMHSVLNYIVPWTIDKQIQQHFSEAEAGIKVRLNMLLGLPAKEKEVMGNMFMPQPAFTFKYFRKVNQKIPNFSLLQKEFRKELDKLIDEAIGEIS